MPLNIIDTLLEAFGEWGSVQIMSHAVQQLIERGKTDQKFEFIAFLLLSQMGEYISDPQELLPIISIVINKTKSESGLQRFGSFLCLGQFGHDMPIRFHELYGHVVLPALIVGSKDSVRKVALHAVFALSNYLEGAKRGSLESFTSPIFDALFQLLSSDSIEVRKKVVLCFKFFFEVLHDSSQRLRSEEKDKNDVKVIDKLVSMLHDILSATHYDLLELQVRLPSFREFSSFLCVESPRAVASLS